MLAKKIPASRINYRSYLDRIRINQSFFLRPEEIQEMICAFNINKTLGPNSLHIYILKFCGHFFSECLIKFVNLSFTTGIFPEFCKIAKVIPILKKDEPLCVNYRPISILPIFSKIIEKNNSRMYSFLSKNKLLHNKQFGFRTDHSTSHALISQTETSCRNIYRYRKSF